MRADRLVSIVLLLQTHGRQTARSLAERLEVSERTIHRDMAALSGAGVPVYAERGAGGGWMLDRDFRTDLTGLSAGEARSLFVGAPARLIADLGLAGEADAALIKVLAALPAVARHAAEHVQARILIDAPGWRRGEEPVPRLAALQAAVLGDRRIRLAYGRTEGDVKVRVVDPLGLVAKGTTWYLVAGCDGEERTYRVSRVAGVEPTGEPANRPDGFSLTAYWARSVADFVEALPSFPIEVLVAPDIVEHLWYPGSYVQIETIADPGPDGWRRARLILHTEEHACRYALGFGPRLIVKSPAALRERIAREAREIAATYEAGQ